MTASELAQQLGLTRQAVSKLSRRGMPLDSLEAAQKWRAVHAPPRQKNFALPATETSPSPFDDALDRAGRARAAEQYAFAVLKASAASKDIRLTGRALRDFLTAAKKAAEAEQAAIAAGLASHELVRARDIEQEYFSIVQPFFHSVKQAAENPDLRWYMTAESVAKEMKGVLFQFFKRLTFRDLFSDEKQNQTAQA